MQFVSETLVFLYDLCAFVAKNLYVLKCLIWFKINAKNNACLIRAIRFPKNLIFPQFPPCLCGKKSASKHYQIIK